MSMQGSYYVPVEANSVMPMAEGNSGEGGYEMDGSYVNWTTNGITGISWPIGNDVPNSPFEGMNVGETNDSNDILWVISEQGPGNLNSIFYAWSQKYSLSEQDEFMNYAKRMYGYTDDNGCIGEQLYL